MKLKITVLFFVLLSACTMNAKNIEAACYSHKSFADVSACISEEVAKTDAKSRSAPLYEKYTHAAKLIELEVEKKNVSEEEARLLLSIFRANLEEEDKLRFSEELANFRKLGNSGITDTRVPLSDNIGEMQDGYNVIENQVQSTRDNKVYSADECIGSVIMGKCHGSIMNNGGYKPTCHGEWMNGMCTGPMF